ncbi:MAG: hypothetical protein ABFD54_17265 [Armatimonadota bacterium]
MIYLTALLALGLALIHTLGGRLSFLNVIPRSIWLSMAGGVSVAYVFVHILPDLSHHQEVVQKLGVARSLSTETHVYLLALVGLAVFYGLERAARIDREQNRQLGAGDETGARVFWLHMSSFGIYNMLIGYLLVHRERPGILSMVLFFVAMGLHFVVNDFALWNDHKDRYRKIGRWILAATVIAGWAIGVLTPVHPLLLAFLFAFLAGGVVLNVLKEELPAERKSRFWAFALGSGVYAGLLLLV